jgi:hypothetical protein
MRRRLLKRLMIPTFILVSVLMAIALLASRNPASVSLSQWHDAAKSAPTGLMAQVIQDNISPDLPIDAGRMKVWKIQQPEQSKPLYLVDSRVANLADYPHANPLCGVTGCAFFAYISLKEGEFQQVWSEYLNVNLPPGILLIEPSHELKHGLPKLRINQMKGKQVQQLQLTFNGKVYETTNILLLPKNYD